MSETVHTAITLALISGILMAVIGQLFARSALELMATPDDVINLSSLYLRIYFLGMPFFMLYNYGAAILRAVGDTKRPLFFLIISGSVNAILNLLLVIVFHLDVAGVAISTVIAQMISCTLVLTCLYRSDSSYQLRFSKLKIQPLYMKQIFQVFLQVSRVPSLTFLMYCCSPLSTLSVRQPWPVTPLPTIFSDLCTFPSMPSHRPA